MEDPILFWNEVALEINRLDHTGGMDGEHQAGPTLSSRALAIVHLAMHDAFFGVVGVTAIPGPATPPKRLYLNPSPGTPPTNSAVNLSAAVSGAAGHGADDAVLGTAPAARDKGRRTRGEERHE